MAAIIGLLVAIVAHFSARWQIRASVRSAEWQAWSESLRKAIANYLATEAMARSFNRLEKADPSSSIDRIEEIMRLSWHIDLLLNPQEEDHSRLSSLLKTMNDTINRNDIRSRVVDTQIDDLRHQVLDLSRTIVKRKWERLPTQEAWRKKFGLKS